MNIINYEKAREMREIIEKYNSYGKSADELLLKKSSVKDEYLYHVTLSDEMMDNFSHIKKHGLKTASMYNFSEYISSKYNDYKPKRVLKMLDLLDKLKVLYCSPKTACSIFGIGLSEADSKFHKMFRFKTSLTRGYLYKDPETLDCFATICLINIPAKYLEIGTPIKTIKSKGSLDLDFVYKWKNLA